MTMYAVIDLETTGLAVGWNHRICEIAIVRLDHRGRLIDEWSSLVNPGRDLGPQALHGINAADVRHAPRFADLAGDIARRLAGHVIAAHNLMFDAGFLRSEFGRLGHDVPLAAELGLCTMRLAPVFLPHAGRSLADCCAAAGINNPYAHSALHDARAAGALLSRYLTLAGDPPPWHHLARIASTTTWPHIPASSVTPVHRGAATAAPEHFLARLVDRLPRVPIPRQADQYLSLLDTVLVDRHISATEADALIETAGALGLNRDDVLLLHRRYLRALAVEALDDGILTEAELADLTAVASLLALPPQTVSDAIAAAKVPAITNPGFRSTIRFRLSRGEIVVFTGQTEEPREVWESRARDAGLVVRGGVTKSTRVLVAADPDSLSGKARQARRYQIPIIRPADFHQKIAELATH